MKIFILTLLAVWEITGQNNHRCINPNGDTGECIKVDDCPAILAMFKEVPMTTETRKFIGKAHCGYQNRKPFVCCTVENAPTPPPLRKRFSDELPTPGECGFSLQDKILSGATAKITDFPWMALLQYTKPDGSKDFHCAGSLINDQYVITAAHCKALIPNDWILSGVRLGEWDTNTEVDCDTSEDPTICSPPYVDIEISEIIMHEDYKQRARTQYHDIALLRLKEKVTYSKYITPICLPIHDYAKNKDHVGNSLEVAGWGKTETENKSNVKLKVAMDGVSLTNCNRVYASTSIKLSDGQICAGGIKGQDSCNGDSGGPLMDIDDVTDPFLPYFYLVGLVSFGPTTCGKAGWPGVYTNIAPYVDWIQKKLKA